MTHLTPLLLTLALTLTLTLTVGCASSSLRKESNALRHSAALATHLRAVDGARVGTPAAPGPARSDIAAPDPAGAPTGPGIADLAFLNAPIDARVWSEAQASDWSAPATLSETRARTVLLARSPRLRAAWKLREARRQRLGQAAWLESLVQQYEGFARDPTKRPATWPLPGPTGLYGRVVGADVDLAEVEFQIAVLDLLVDFTRTFNNAHYLAHAVGVIRNNVDISARVSEVVRTRYQAAKARKSDLLKAQMRLSDMKERLRSTRDARNAAQRSLGALLDVSSRVSAGSTASAGTVPSAKAVRGFSAQMPDLRAAQLRSHRAVSMLELAERRIQPDLSDGLSERAGRPAKATFPVGYARGGGGFIAELRDRSAAFVAADRQAQTAVPARAEMARSTMSDAVRTARLYRNTQVSRAEQALKSAESEYRVGRTTYLSLDDVQRLWLDASLKRHALERDARIAGAQLRRVLGGRP